MSRRSYDQFCALAQALDRVGGRWTMLIVRELLPGPARFTELQAGLPGIATNLLTDRLRALEADGIVQHRRLPPPASVDVYELTGSGRELEPALSALGRWGLRFMPTAPYRGDPESIRGVALAAMAMARRSEGPDVRVDFDFANDRFLTVEITDGELDVVLGPHPDPDATVTIAFMEFLQMALGTNHPSTEPGRIAGDPDAVERVEAAFSQAPDAASA